MATGTLGAPRKCSSCGTEVVWVLTKNNKRMPVDASSATEEEKISINAIGYDAKRHISHFATCPDAKQFRHR